MRTTIDITDEQRAALLALAAKRGLRGYSALVQEAIDLYLKEKENKGAKGKKALRLRGILTDEEAALMRKEIGSLWSKWRVE